MSRLEFFNNLGNNQNIKSEWDGNWTNSILGYNGQNVDTIQSSRESRRWNAVGVTEGNNGPPSIGTSIKPRPNGYKTSSPAITEYGSVLVTADNLAQQRGSGRYNPIPNSIQTVNRGPAQQNSLQLYGQSGTYKENQNYSMETYDSTEKGWSTVPQELNDISKTDGINGLEGYVVGSTRLHSENSGSWNRPDFKNSTGFNQYQVWAAKSLNSVPTALMNFFFSVDNVNYLQEEMKRQIKKIRDIDIKDQSVDKLLIIMRNKYIYGLSGWLPHDANNPDKVYPRGTVHQMNGLAYNSDINGCTSLEFQVKQLNKAVLEECVKQILSGIDAYKQYYKDISTLPMPLDRSVFTSSKGSNPLQQNIGFESGHEASKAMASYNQRFNII